MRGIAGNVSLTTFESGCGWQKCRCCSCLATPAAGSDQQQSVSGVRLLCFLHSLPISALIGICCVLVTSSAESRAHVQHLLHPGLLQLPACMVEVAVLLQAAIASTVPLPHLACAQQYLASAKCYTETTRRLQPTALSLTAAYSSFDAASCKMLQQLSAAFCLSACIICFSPFS